MAKTGTRGLSSRIIRVSYPLSLNLHILGPAYSRYAHWEKEREGKGKWERKEGKRGGRVRERQTLSLFIYSATWISAEKADHCAP